MDSKHNRFEIPFEITIWSLRLDTLKTCGQIAADDIKKHKYTSLRDYERDWLGRRAIHGEIPHILDHPTRPNSGVHLIIQHLNPKTPEARTEVIGVVAKPDMESKDVLAALNEHFGGTIYEDTDSES